MSRPFITATERRCKVCGVVKPIEAFRRRGTKRGLLRSCDDCYRAQRRAESAADKRVGRRVAISTHRRQREFRERLWTYLLDHPCVDCGEPDPMLLDFDHLDPSQKIERVAMLARRSSWAAVVREVAKCEVRCANCHRRRTARQFGWYWYLGRDHRADERAAIDALYGRLSLFDAPEPPPPGLKPNDGVVVTNLAQRLNEYMAIEPTEFGIGDEAVVLVRGRQQADGSVAATEAVILRMEEVA